VFFALLTKDHDADDEGEIRAMVQLVEEKGSSPPRRERDPLVAAVAARPLQRGFQMRLSVPLARLSNTWPLRIKTSENAYLPGRS
jgi:hypothetical protein